MPHPVTVLIGITKVAVLLSGMAGGAAREVSGPHRGDR